MTEAFQCFFYNYIDVEIKKQWIRERRKLKQHYKALINDQEFSRIFVIKGKNRWNEVKAVLKSFFLEELYWSALIILIAEKIIKIAKPKIYVNVNCFSYCTREVALTMKKHGVKIVHIAEGIMNFNNFSKVASGRYECTLNIILLLVIYVTNNALM